MRTNAPLAASRRSKSESLPRTRCTSSTVWTRTWSPSASRYRTRARGASRMRLRPGRRERRRSGRALRSGSGADGQRPGGGSGLLPLRSRGRRASRPPQPRQCRPQEHGGRGVADHAGPRVARDPRPSDPNRVGQPQEEVRRHEPCAEGSHVDADVASPSAGAERKASTHPHDGRDGGHPQERRECPPSEDSLPGERRHGRRLEGDLDGGGERQRQRGPERTRCRPPPIPSNSCRPCPPVSRRRVKRYIAWHVGRARRRLPPWPLLVAAHIAPRRG